MAQAHNFKSLLGNTFFLTAISLVASTTVQADNLPCDADIAQFCKASGEEDSKWLIKCLKKHKKEVSETCRASIEEDVKDVVADHEEAQNQTQPEQPTTAPSNGGASAAVADTVSTAPAQETSIHASAQGTVGTEKAGSSERREQQQIQKQIQKTQNSATEFTRKQDKLDGKAEKSAQRTEKAKAAAAAHAATGPTYTTPESAPGAIGTTDKLANPFTWWQAQNRAALGSDAPGCGVQFKTTGCHQATKEAPSGHQKNQAFVDCLYMKEELFTPKCRWNLTRKAFRMIEQGKAENPMLRLGARTEKHSKAPDRVAPPIPVNRITGEAAGSNSQN